MNSIKCAVKTQLRLARWKTRLGKRLKDVTNPERRDHYKGPVGRKHTEEMEKKQNLIETPDEFKALSDYETINEGYDLKRYDKDVYNREIKKSMNLKLDTSFSQLVFSEKDNPKQLMTPEADRINKINAAEWDKYRLEFYKKSEVKRLLEKKGKTQEVGLSSGGYVESSSFVQNFIQQMKHEGMNTPNSNRKVGDMAEAEKHVAYRKDVAGLKNEKIEGLFMFENSNEKLKELMEHGFMDSSKSLGSVFQMLMDSKNGSTGSREQIELQEGGSESQNSEQTDLVKQQVALMEEFKLMLEGNPEKETAMAIVHQAVYSGGLQGRANSDYAGLVSFVQDFLGMDEEEKAHLIERIKKIGQVRSYEEGVFQDREKHMIEGRGKPTFSKLTPEERVPYVKHNANSYKDIYRIVKENETLVTNDTDLSIAMVEKVALTAKLGPMFYKNSDYVDLHAIGDPSYAVLLKIVKNKLNQLGFDTLARTLFALGMLHRREQGQLIPGLYQDLAKKSVMAMSNQLDRYTSMEENANWQPTPAEKSNLMYHFGVGLEGLMTLGCINGSTPLPFVYKSLVVLRENIGFISQGCTLNRILTYLLRIESSFGDSINPHLNEAVTDLLHNLNKSKALATMSRPDLKDLMLILPKAISIGIDSQIIQPIAAQLRDQLLAPDNRKFLAIQDLSTMLVMLSYTNALDTNSKNIIKVKFRELLPFSQNLMSYILPMSMELLAVSDLRDANKYYQEYTNPLDLLYMKSIFGLRAFQYDDTPKFDIYKEMYKLVSSHPEKLSLGDLVKLLDGLCVVEVPLEPFHYSILEKHALELMEKNSKEPNNVNMKVATRMTLLFSILGVQNLQRKWLRISIDGLNSSSSLKKSEIFEILHTADPEILLEEVGYEDLERFITPVVESAESLSDTRKVILAWTLAKQQLLTEYIPDILSQINFSALKQMDLLLVSQISSYSPQHLPVSSEILTEFFKSVFMPLTHIVQSDSASLYQKMVEALDKDKVDYRYSFLLKGQKGITYVPLFLNDTKECIFIYPNDLFLKDLEIEQQGERGFAYKFTTEEQLPPFFEFNEAEVESLGLKALRLDIDGAKKTLGIKV